MPVEEFRGHIRAMRADSEYLGAEDLLDAGDVPFKIIKVLHKTNHKACGKLQEEMFTLVLEGASGKQYGKELWLKSTNRRSIALLHGGNVKDWVGKWIWLGVEECRSPSGGQTLGIRVRARKDAPPPPQPTQQQPASAGKGGAA